MGHGKQTFPFNVYTVWQNKQLGFVSVQTPWKEEKQPLDWAFFPARVQSGRKHRSRPGGRAGKAKHFIFLNESENFQIWSKRQTDERSLAGVVVSRGVTPCDLLTFRGALTERSLAPERHAEI